jgi:ribosome recycling factor
MQKPIDVLNNQLKNIHYGGITPSVVDTVRVSCYGQQMPISQIAFTQAVKNNISVAPYDVENLSSINKALQAAGFTSYVFSKTSIMVSVPPPSLEEKEKICSHLKKLGEEAKISVRNIRKNIRQSFAKNDKESLKKIEKELQMATDEAIEDIDVLIQNKIESL